MADAGERAGRAFFGFVDCGWKFSGIENTAGAGYGGFDELAEGFIKGNLGAAARYPVEEKAFGNRYGEHLFEAEGLGAELDFIGAVGFGLSAFVFDGDDESIGMELHDIALTGQPEVIRADGEGSGGADGAARLGGGIVDALVENPPFGSISVLKPFTVQVDEGELAFAKHQVLERGDGEVQFGHATNFQSSYSGRNTSGPYMPRTG